MIGYFTYPIYAPSKLAFRRQIFDAIIWNTVTAATFSDITSIVVPCGSRETLPLSPYSLLSYMAVTLQSSSDVDLAMTYLKERAERQYIKNWPGPAALFLLGRVALDDAVQSATGFADLAKAKDAAEQDLMKRRRLTNILFSAAVERRIANDEPGCRKYMAECASLTTPLIEYEWHLAKGEVTAR